MDMHHQHNRRSVQSIAPIIADRFDALATLETWVELGVPPSTILATNADGTLTRPLCPYPQLPRHNGRGNANAAISFTCSSQ